MALSFRIGKLGKFEVQICVLNSRHKIVRHVAFQEVNDLFSKHRVKFLHQSNCTCAGRQIFHQEQNTFVGTFGPIKFFSEFQKYVHSFIGVFSFSFCPGSNSNSLSELPAFDSFVDGQMPFLADSLSNFLFLASLINILSSKFEPAMTTLLL